MSLLNFSRPWLRVIFSLFLGLCCCIVWLVHIHSNLPSLFLVAILPVTPSSVPSLERTLASLVSSPSRLRKLILVYPQSLALQVHAVASSFPHLALEHIPNDDLGNRQAIRRVVAQLSTDWILILEPSGLTSIAPETRHTSLNPPLEIMSLDAKGLRASFHSLSCFQPPSPLRPPLFIPTSLASESLHLSSNETFWLDLGKHISMCHLDGGMLVLNHELEGPSSSHISVADPPPDSPDSQQPFILDHPPRMEMDQNYPSQTSKPSDTSLFAVLIPTVDDLSSFHSLLCGLRAAGHETQIFIYRDFAAFTGVSAYGTRGFTSQLCTLTYTFYSPSTGRYSRTVLYSSTLEWFKNLDSDPDVLLCPAELAAVFIPTRDTGFLANTVVIYIPLEDALHAAWMSSLTIHEWRNWNSPRVDISVITNDRPDSLSRLLSSLSEARYFGDVVDIRIYLEDSADAKTLGIVNDFSWTKGRIFIHHRVLHAGLLPAVVESWYPHSNNTYGLLLEDDIEVSPLFYAWAKMALLRYRYGDASTDSSRLFGISLYQQKNLELPSEGRRPFNARTLFAGAKLPFPSSPYLSPVPCSWGAIYFPEHWREFHAYLLARRSSPVPKSDLMVVPDVRSNRWTKSWKKYFIELAYLRGYVMLYPNYPEFVSLSTNHLEVGSHVKKRTKAKRDLFVLPLMELQTTSASLPGDQLLLHLPSGRMPAWEALPVLNLTGALTTLDELVETGLTRRSVLTGCTNTPAAFDVFDLLCLSRQKGAL